MSTYALRHAVVDCLDDIRDRRERDGAQGDEEGAEGNGDNFGNFRWAAHEDGAKEVFHLPAICRDKVRLGVTRNHIGKLWSWTATRAQLQGLSEPKGALRMTRTPFNDSPQK